MIKSGYNMATIPDIRPGMFQSRSDVASPCPPKIQCGLYGFSSATMCCVLGRGDLSLGIILFSVPRTLVSRSTNL